MQMAAEAAAGPHWSYAVRRLGAKDAARSGTQLDLYGHHIGSTFVECDRTATVTAGRRRMKP